MSGQLVQRNKERFKRFLEKRFSLRLHMFLILSGVFFVGVLSSKIMLLMHLNSMLIRYPLSVVFSYLAFFCLVKLWLIYLSSSTGRRSGFVDGGSGGGSSGISIDLPGSGSGGPSFGGGGGGSFGGGGASASFDGSPEIQMPGFAVAPQDSGEGLGGDIAEGAGKAVSGIFDGDDAWVLIVLGIVLAVICGSGIYLIYQAPMILSDAAFQAMLSTSLIRRMKKMSDPDWIGSILHATAIPFIVVLIAAGIVAWAAHHAHPRAARMSEVVLYIIHK